MNRKEKPAFAATSAGKKGCKVFNPFPLVLFRHLIRHRSYVLPCL